MPKATQTPLAYEPPCPSAIARLVQEIEGKGCRSASGYNRTYNRHNR